MMDLKESIPKGRNGRRKIRAKAIKANAVREDQRLLDQRTVPEERFLGTLAPVTDLVLSKEKTTIEYAPSLVERSDYWRDRSARDEKSQSIVVARIKNEDASEGPSHSSASISTLFKHSGLVFELDFARVWRNLNPLNLALTFSAEVHALRINARTPAINGTNHCYCRRCGSTMNKVFQLIDADTSHDAPSVLTQKFRLPIFLPKIPPECLARKILSPIGI